MITTEQIKTWIESHGAHAACPDLDSSRINLNKGKYLYFYRNPHNLMWYCEHEYLGGVDYCKATHKSTISDIISDVRDYLINKID